MYVYMYDVLLSVLLVLIGKECFQRQLKIQRVVIYVYLNVFNGIAKQCIWIVFYCSFDRPKNSET